MKSLFLSVLVLVVGCKRGDAPAQKHEPEPAAEHVHETEHEALPRQVKLTEQVIVDAKLQFAPATREVLSETLSLPGEISADPDQLARILSPTAGRVEEVRFKEGAVVKKGDVLVVLRVPEVGKVRSTFAATESRACSSAAT